MECQDNQGEEEVSNTEEFVVEVGDMNVDNERGDDGGNGDEVLAS